MSVSEICNKDLGMASGEIPDSGILVSSELVNHEKEKMRFGLFESKYYMNIIVRVLFPKQ